MAYINIHLHTALGSNLKFRDSINKIEDAFEYSHSLGHSGVCITDHESITAHLNALEYYQSIKDKEEWSGFKLGLGNEIYLCSDSCVAENIATNVYPHFILLALDKKGHQGIRELSSIAWTKNNFMHVQMRTPTYYHDLEDMVDKYRGHIIGSSACLGNPLCRRLLDYKTNRSPITWQQCIEWVEYMKELFGNDYFYLELQPNPSEEQIWCNAKLIELAEFTNTNYIVSTDAHYLKRSDREIHKTFLNSEQSEREVDDFYQTTYIMSETEIHEYLDQTIGFDKAEKAINNTMLIYDKLEDYDLKKKLHIPYTPLNTEEPNVSLYNKYKDKVPLYKNLFESEYDSDRHLLRRLLEYMDSDPYYQRDKAYNAVNECLDYLLQSSEVNDVRWSAYLISMADYIDICWEVGSVVGAGRGSGVGFCLLYMLGITQVDPLREDVKTYPWRFLNPKRTSVLDIDVDIAGFARDKIVERLKEIYGKDKVCKVLTIQTEKARSAILTAGRGIGLDNDLTSYIASLVVFDRGTPRSLHTMYYGNEDYKPVPEFVKEMNAHPNLWEAAQKIEGLPCGCGSHAGGVIIDDEPLTNSTALMRTSSGDIISQYDLHKCEDVSLIKIDLLATDAVWKIQECLHQLVKAGRIEWQGSLRKTYESYINIYSLERNDIEMWKKLWNHEIISFFQMEKQSGIQALALTHPTSVADLCSINSVIRLMPQTPEDEIPLQKYARYHENISLWYEEMDKAGLTKEEQKLLEPILLNGSGICEAQEKFMQLVQIPECGGFDLQFADALRKAVAKKNPKAYIELEERYFKETTEKGLSKNLCNYVWHTLIATSRGYGFNLSHCLAYSLIGLQELNLVWKPKTAIYWNTANLVVDSGAGDEESNDSTNYGKMAVAIARIQNEGVTISPPSINTSEFGFSPSEETNEILFGLKGINSINTDISNQIITHRPYDSMDEFAQTFLDTKIVKPTQMYQLIKGGCFDEFNSDRREVMSWYLYNYIFEPCKSLTLSQLKKIEELDIIPEDLKICNSYLKYKAYVLSDEGWVEDYINPEKKVPKCGYHDRYFVLDNPSQKFFKEHFSEDSIVKVQGEYYVVSEKLFSKEVDKLIQPLREWMANENTLKLYNEKLFEHLWNEKCPGNEAAWSMQALSYYDKNHELENIDEKAYGIVNYFDLSEDPDHYETYTRWIEGEMKEIPKLTIRRITGTVINSDNSHAMISLLTCYGVVNVKFNKNAYSFYNKRISKVIDDSDKKQVIENSWFKRGNLLVIAGFRSGENFIPRTYNDSVWKHTVNLITAVNPDGTLDLQLERTKI